MSERIMSSRGRAAVRAWLLVVAVQGCTRSDDRDALPEPSTTGDAEPAASSESSSSGGSSGESGESSAAETSGSEGGGHGGSGDTGDPLCCREAGSFPCNDDAVCCLVTGEPTTEVPFVCGDEPWDACVAADACIESSCSEDPCVCAAACDAATGCVDRERECP